jgi:RNA polymerase sigma-B factor
MPSNTVSPPSSNSAASWVAASTSTTTAADTPAADATRRSQGGYEDLEPLFEEMAALPADHPLRARLRDDLISRCLPLADHLARKFAGRGEPFDDLVQVARIGLVNAVDRFDVSRGARFLGYAVPTMTGEIRRHFRDHTWALRISRPLKELHVRIGPAVQSLSQRLGRAPTAAEIAAEVDADPADVAQAIAAGNAYQPLSIDSPAYGGDDTPIAETLYQSDPGYHRIEEFATVAPLIASLAERERRILMMRFFESMTQTEIASKLGISQMQVSRILAATLASLRDRARADNA